MTGLLLLVREESPLLTNSAWGSLASCDSHNVAGDLVQHLRLKLKRVCSVIIRTCEITVLSKSSGLKDATETETQRSQSLQPRPQNM